VITSGGKLTTMVEWWLPLPAAGSTNCCGRQQAKPAHLPGAQPDTDTDQTCRQWLVVVSLSSECDTGGGLVGSGLLACWGCTASQPIVACAMWPPSARHAPWGMFACTYPCMQCMHLCGVSMPMVLLSDAVIHAFKHPCYTSANSGLVGHLLSDTL